MPGSSSGAATPRGEVLADFADPLDRRFLAYMSSGPLPDPMILEAYEQIVPGSAKTLFEEYKAQGRHRRALEAKVVEAGVAQQRLGTICGTLLSGMAIVGGCLVAAVASPTAGGAIAGTASIALATAFVIGQRSQRKEREAKARISAEMQRGMARVEDDQLSPPTPDAGPA